MRLKDYPEIFEELKAALDHLDKAAHLVGYRAFLGQSKEAKDYANEVHNAYMNLNELYCKLITITPDEAIEGYKEPVCSFKGITIPKGL